MKFVFAILPLLIAASPVLAQDDTARVTIRALLSVSGPEASSATEISVSRGGEVLGEAEGPLLEIDLEPGNYVAEARSGIATRRERLRIRPGGRDQDVRVNLNAGVLAVRSRSAEHMVLMEPEPDVFGDQRVLAETDGQTWALTVPQGRFRLLIEGAGGRKILDQDVEIVPARREVITTR